MHIVPCFVKIVFFLKIIITKKKKVTTFLMFFNTNLCVYDKVRNNTRCTLCVIKYVRNKMYGYFEKGIFYAFTLFVFTARRVLSWRNLKNLTPGWEITRCCTQRAL